MICHGTSDAYALPQRREFVKGVELRDSGKCALQVSALTVYTCQVTQHKTQYYYMSVTDILYISH